MSTAEADYQSVEKNEQETSKRGNSPWQRIVSLSASATKISTHFARQLLYDFLPKCVTATA